MNGIKIYPVGKTMALTHACHFLACQGLDIADGPSADVTHLLLPVPSFEPTGQIKGGADLVHILSCLPKDITVMGGNLRHPALAHYKCVDFLQDPVYLAENAAITAQCAITIVANNLPVTLRGCPILIIGWGRIGKCLAADLLALGADVTVAARNPADRAMLLALGYRSIATADLTPSLMRYRVILNTVPVPMLSELDTVHCRRDCIKIDLASQSGIAGNDVIWAKGLPNQETPESSGKLIAKTVIRLAAGKEESL
jgi:dipicolinate synthase subunit A